MGAPQVDGSTDDAPPTIGIVGIGGYGAQHVANVLRLAEGGRVRFVGSADSLLREGIPGVPHFDDLDDLLRLRRPDVLVIATPIHLHGAMALRAFAAGVHVLLEKPPATSRWEHRALVDAAKAAGVHCQVGFQSLGSDGVPALRRMLAEGRFGEVRGVGAVGAWARDDAYWRRSSWAGRREFEGLPVVDGVLTNPFAHAVATALAVLGQSTESDVVGVELEQYRANAIECDDTSSAVIRLAGGRVAAIGATLCAEIPESPYLVVRGTEASARYRYTQDELEVVRHADGFAEVTQYGRRDLLENLVDAVCGRAPLMVPLAETSGFTELLEAVRRAPAPTTIDPPVRRDFEDSWGKRAVVLGAAEACREVGSRLAGFREVEAPWVTR